jgi:DNA polymerase elongation subunit (family B)
MNYLSIYPNARGFGYCVTTEPCTFLDYGVVTVRPISNEKCLKRISKLIKKYSVDAIITQNLAGKYAYKTKRVKDLHTQIEILAKEKELKLYTYSREQIRFVFKEHGALTKYQIAKLITNWFEEDLRDYAPTYRKPWMCEDHNMGLYDALSLYLTYWYLEK